MKQKNGSAVFKEIKNNLNQIIQKTNKKITYQMQNTENLNLKTFDVIKITKSNGQNEESIFLLIYRSENENTKISIETFTESFEGKYDIKFKDKANYQKIIDEIKKSKLETEFAECFADYFQDLKTLYNK